MNHYLKLTANISHLSDRFKISSTQVAEEMAETSKDLTKRAVALVELAADSWIVTGRKPIPVMMAAIYLAWQSLKPNKQRLKFSLDKFCQMAKVNKNNAASRRINEIKEVLCKLGKEIPWVREAVTPDNVARHVEDILQHRYALLRRAMRTQEDALLAECQSNFVDSLTEERAPPQSLLEEPALNPERTEKPVDGDEEHSDESQEPAPNWGERVLFAPPCVINAKRKREEQEEFEDVNGDEDISDSEIDLYIRTPQEVRDFARTQRMFSLSDRGTS